MSSNTDYDVTMLYFVIPTYNQIRRLPRCLDSIIQYTTIMKYEIVIIDNNPPLMAGVIGQYISRQRDVPFTVFHCPGNAGVARSWNMGIRYGFACDGEFVICVNDDIYFRPDAVNRLVQFSRDNADYGLVTTPRFGFQSFLIKEWCWDKVGAFDEAFWPAYFEDNDYIRRMELLGIKWGDAPKEYEYASGEGSRTINTDAGFRQRMAQVLFPRNREYYIAKWGGEPGKEKYIYPFGCNI